MTGLLGGKRRWDGMYEWDVLRKWEWHFDKHLRSCSCRGLRYQWQVALLLCSLLVPEIAILHLLAPFVRTLSPSGRTFFGLGGSAMGVGVRAALSVLDDSCGW